ncbi:glyoxalase [Microvirga mediterraneensis]|nr:glyoxalase [Microvirga mediterraneensis]
MLRIDHVQLAIPKGSEDLCRLFYVDLLGMTEIPKPETLAGRGGLWLQSGEIQLHLGVEDDFRPARKAHPAFAVAEIDQYSIRFMKNGFTPVWDDAIPGIRRFYVSDPVGNRIEFIGRTIP